MIIVKLLLCAWWFEFVWFDCQLLKFVIEENK